MVNMAFGAINNLVYGLKWGSKNLVKWLKFKSLCMETQWSHRSYVWIAQEVTYGFCPMKDWMVLCRNWHIGVWEYIWQVNQWILCTQNDISGIWMVKESIYLELYRAWMEKFGNAASIVNQMRSVFLTSVRETHMIRQIYMVWKDICRNVFRDLWQHITYWRDAYWRIHD